MSGFPDTNVNWDYIHPKRFFEILKESEVLNNSYKWETFEAFLEVESFDEFERRVEIKGSDWDDDIYLYRNQDWYDLGYNYLHDCYKISDFIDCYVDYQRFGEELRFDGYQEYSEGIIEIR